MPGGVEQNGSTLGPREVDVSRGTSGFPRLLRYSHILSSAVREVLEINLLKEVTPLSINVTQFHLLKLMTLDGQHQVGELAGVLGMSAPATSKNIDKLAGLGLVERNVSREDRRATILNISTEGRELVRRFEDCKTDILAPLAEEFEPGEIEELSGLIERLSVSLLKLNPPGQEVCLRCAAYIEDDCAIGELCGGCPYRRFLEAQRNDDSDEGASRKH